MQGSGHGSATDGRATGAENTGFFARDAVEIVTQHRHMVEPDGDYSGGIGVEKVHRIQSATEAHFQHPGVQSGALKQPHRGSE